MTILQAELLRDTREVSHISRTMDSNDGKRSREQLEREGLFSIKKFHL